METYRERIVPMLSSFVGGLSSLADLSLAVDNRLFELRQRPDESDEKAFLSGIELMISEVQDGFRPSGDLEEYVRSLLTVNTLEVNWCGENCSLIPVILSSSNRDVSASVVVIPVPPVVDLRLQATFA